MMRRVTAPGMATRAFTVLSAVALLAVGCGTASDVGVANGDDPMKALEARATSTRYTAGYWQTQADQNPTLWQNAVAYCDSQTVTGQGSRPNCSAVRSAQFEIAGRARVQERPRRGAADQGFRP